MLEISGRSEALRIATVSGGGTDGILSVIATCQSLSCCARCHHPLNRTTTPSSKQQSFEPRVDPIAFALAKVVGSSGYFENLDLLGDAAE